MRAPAGALRSSIPTATVPVPSTDAGPAPTPRRLIGLAVIVAAVVATLAAAPLLGVGVRGAASAAAIPLPPPVGSCVLIADDDTATVVDCAEPHTGEIAMTWRAGVTPVDAGSLGRTPHFSVTRSITHADADPRCTGWAQRYTGWDRYLARHDDDLWLPPQPLTVGRMVRAPALPDLAWTGCAALTADPSYVGSIRDAAFAPRPGTTTTRPAGVSVCLSSTDTGLTFGSCSEPHNVELLGSISLSQQMMAQRSVTLDHTAAEITAGCADLAADRIGRVDPTFGGTLEVVTESVWQRSLGDQPPASSSWLIPDCLIRVVGPGTLTGSLVEWGEQPLQLSR